MFSMHEVRGVFYLSGELDHGTVNDFDAGITKAFDSTGELILDLSDLTFIDSMGVRMLALLSRRVGGGIVLRDPHDAVMPVLELLQVDEMPGIRLQVN